MLFIVLEVVPSLYVILHGPEPVNETVIGATLPLQSMSDPAITLVGLGFTIIVVFPDGVMAVQGVVAPSALK